MADPVEDDLNRRAAGRRRKTPTPRTLAAIGRRPSAAVMFLALSAAAARRLAVPSSSSAVAAAFSVSRATTTTTTRARHSATRFFSSSSSADVTESTAADADEAKNFDTDDDAVIAHVAPRNFVPVPFQYREELTLRVETLTNLGLGICRATTAMPGQFHPGADPHASEDDPLYGADPFHGLSCDVASKLLPLDDADAKTVDEGGESKNQRRRKRRLSKKAASEALPPDIDAVVSSGGGGWVVMVPNVIPGELIKCAVFRNRPKYSEADLVEVVEPSPERVTPPCALFEKCGGCQYQHMSVGMQREWKRRQVSDLFERVGKFKIGTGTDASEGDCPAILPTLGTEEIYHYRSKITPHYDKPRQDSIGILTINAIGFKEKTSRRLVDVPYCHIATEAINEKLTSVREDKFAEAIEDRLKRPKKGATLLLRDAHDLHTGAPVVSTDNNEYVTSTVSNIEFKFQAGNFFQNNPFVLPHMVERVVSAAVAPNHEGAAMTHLIDCYCGSGLFCLGAASQFDVCVGIEVNDRAVQEATDNAQRNDIRNCKFVAASAEAIFAADKLVEVTHAATGETHSELVRDFPRSTTTVVIDPPRKGCSPEFLKQLEEFGPQRVVYMSCDPSTQARDARAIADAGYDIVSVEPFDLFPQTRHIECLAVFERVSASAHA